MTKVICKAVVKAISAVIVIFTTVGGFTYLTKFDIAQFLQDNKPHSYIYLGMSSLIVFLASFAVLVIIDYYKVKKENIKVNTDLNNSTISLTQTKQKLIKAEAAISQVKSELDKSQNSQIIEKPKMKQNEVRSKHEINELVVITQELLNSINDIYKKLMKAHKYNGGSVSSYHDSEYKRAKKNYFEIRYKVDIPLQEFIEKHKMYDISKFPLLKIFDEASLQSLADSYESDGYINTYDNKTTLNMIENESDKIESLLASFISYLEAEKQLEKS